MFPASSYVYYSTLYELGSTPKTSRRHAELQWADEPLRLTLLNGKPPSAPVGLSRCDHIRFANLEFEIVTQ